MEFLGRGIAEKPPIEENGECHSVAEERGLSSEVEMYDWIQ